MDIKAYPNGYATLKPKVGVPMEKQLHAVCASCNAVNRIPAERNGKEINCGKCHLPLFGSAPLSVGQAAFSAQIAKSDVPVVVDFWAPWCGPCKAMAPAFAQVSARMDSRARFIKVNTEEEQALGAQYGIRSIPTLAIFQSGKEIARISGAMPAASLEQWIDNHIAR
jgi:thioredoxin 2